MKRAEKRERRMWRDGERGERGVGGMYAAPGVLFNVLLG